MAAEGRRRRAIKVEVFSLHMHAPSDSPRHLLALPSIIDRHSRVSTQLPIALIAAAMILSVRPLLFLTLIALVSRASVAFKITRLDVPSQVRQGSTARLRCEYELVPYRKLYTLRWLKNNVEFYRYDPDSDDSRHNFYRIHGLHVNVSLSTLVWYTCMALVWHFVSMTSSPDGNVQQHSRVSRSCHEGRHGRIVHV